MCRPASAKVASSASSCVRSPRARRTAKPSAIRMRTASSVDPRFTGRWASPLGSLAMSGRIWAIVIGVTLVVLRAPSLIEPPQFSDEGTYADIGFALDHGAVLYRDVWDNKPPGVYWLAALINLVQRSVTAYHIVAAIVVVVTACAVFMIGRRVLSDRAGWIAAFAFVVMGSLPLFAGDVL